MSYQIQQKDNRRTTEGHIQESKESKKSKERKKKTFLSDSIEVGLSELLFNEILSRKPDFKKPNLQTWAAHIDRMIRLDRRRPERIRAVISWCQQDDFWQNNILSTDKLRKQFDQLELKKDSEDGVNRTKKTIAEQVKELEAEGRL